MGSQRDYNSEYTLGTDADLYAWIIYKSIREIANSYQCAM